MAATNLGRHIRQRVTEKRKSASANRHSVWLLLGIGGIILFTLGRVILMFNPHALSIPSLVWFLVPIHAVQLLLLGNARVKIKKSELPSALRLIQWSAWLAAALSTLLLIGWDQWLGEMVSVSRTAHGAWMVLMIFLAVNYLFATVYLFRIVGMIRASRIHSMSIDSFDNGLLFWAFLGLATAVLLPLLS